LGNMARLASRVCHNMTSRQAKASQQEHEGGHLEAEPYPRRNKRL
jgi:hypothetical protein